MLFRSIDANSDYNGEIAISLGFVVVAMSVSARTGNPPGFIGSQVSGGWYRYGRLQDLTKLD